MIPKDHTVAYIKGFDGLRAISITMVFLTHLGISSYFAHDEFLLSRVVPLFSGGTGVNIFFAISGFLITRILVTEKQATGSLKIKRFFIRRFLRLLPPLIIYYIVLLVLMLTHQINQNYIGLSFSILYLYNFIPRMYYSGELGPTWSLAVEEQFYLIWPFFIAYLNRSIVTTIAFCLIVLCALSYFIYPLIEVSWGPKVYPLTEFTFTQRWFIPAIGAIMIGALTALNFSRIASIKLLTRGYLAVGVALLLMMSSLYLPVILMDFFSIIHATGTCLLLAWIVVNQNSFLTRILEFPVLSYIGKISYGLYVYHGIFIRTAPTGKIFIQQFPVNLILTVAVTICSYHLIEKKILVLKNRIT